MTYQITPHGYIIRLERNEEIIDSLRRFFLRHNINGGMFVGIGAVTHAIIGMYHLDRKDYDFQSFDEPLEIANLTGNVSIFNDELVIHAHITLGDADQNAFGGHLQSAVVDPTCEIYFDNHEVAVSRVHDDDAGLPLLDLPES